MPSRHKVDDDARRCAHSPLALHAELSPADLEDVKLVMWTDADWCGDAEDTKSTSGLLLELLNPNTGRRWPISWAVRRQGSTFNSTCEAETVVLCHAAKYLNSDSYSYRRSARWRKTPH